MLTPEQLRLRVGRITSSVVAAALGKDPDKTPIQAWEEIKGMGSFEGNAATERGNGLEASVLTHGMRAVPNADGWFVPGFTMLAEHRGWAGDSCDAIYRDGWGEFQALGEGKTVGLGNAAKWGEPGTDQVPAKVRIQAYWHLIHYPWAPYCVVPILIGGYDFSYRNYVVPRDDARQGELLERAARWHRDHIVADRPPPVTDGDTEWLKERYPVAQDTMLEPTQEIDDLVAMVLVAKALLKDTERQCGLACNRLREVLGDAAGIKGERYSVSYRNNKDSLKTDWQKLALHLTPTAAQIEQFTRLADGPRVLRVTATKGEAAEYER